MYKKKKLTEEHKRNISNGMNRRFADCKKQCSCYICGKTVIRHNHQLKNQNRVTCSPKCLGKLNSLLKTGKKCSTETKTKMSKSKLGHFVSEKTRLPKRMPVVLSPLRERN